MIVVQTSTSSLFSQKSTDHLVELALAHLAVRDADPGLGHQLTQPRRRPVDRVDLVVHVEDLALAQQLAPEWPR